MQPLVMSIDIGTSSVRAMLWDLHGAARGAAQVAYEMTRTADGGVEMDGPILAGHVADCIDDILGTEQARGAAIGAVGVSTFWHAFLGVDSGGDPITPLFTWSDTRPAADAEQLARRVSSADAAWRTGCPIHGSYYPARLLWLRRTRPDLLHRVSRWVSPGEYLFGLLFGNLPGVPVSIASATGLFNRQCGGWDAEMLAAADTSADTLAPIIPQNTIFRGLAAPWAKRWPALKDVPFAQPAGDGACGNLGSGCSDPSRWALNIGTSAAIRVIPGSGAGESVGAPFGLWRYRVDDTRSIAGAAFSDGGNVFAWLHRTLAAFEPAALETALQSRGPHPDDPVFLPYLSGERSPGWRPFARGAILHLRLGTEPVDIAAAALRSVAVQFLMALNLLTKAYPLPEAVIASGGALEHSPAWRQAIADAIGLPLTMLAQAESSSRGAALLAAQNAGLPAQFENPTGQIITPDAGRHEEYAALCRRIEEHPCQGGG